MFTGSGAKHVAMITMVNHAAKSSQRQAYYDDLADNAPDSPGVRGVLEYMGVRYQHTPGKKVNNTPSPVFGIVRKCLDFSKHNQAPETPTGNTNNEETPHSKLAKKLHDTNFFTANTNQDSEEHTSSKIKRKLDTIWDSNSTVILR